MYSIFSLVNITSTILPFKSQRRALLKKVEKEYGSPDAWSDDVMEKIGTLVDDMDLTEISQLHKDSVCHHCIDIGLIDSKTLH